MAKEIIWSDNAEQDLLAVVVYLKNEWSVKIAETFLLAVHQKANLLSVQPFLGRKTSFRSDLRKFFVTKYNIFFYSVHKNQIIIHRVKDTRRIA